jgi:uncharacterized protein
VIKLVLLSLDILIFLTVLSLAASFVNGGVGYGYSSLSTPLAILVVINKIINPVYVAVEALMNTFMLGVAGKANIKKTFRRVLPIILALVPGVIIGSLVLSLVAPLWVRLIVYAVILPPILLQVAGFRRPIKSEQAAGVPLGFGIGMMYSITTISGPPIALFLNNQGLAKSEFKAGIAQVRIAESYLTCLSYYLLGLFTVTSFQVFSYVAPPILIGIPLGFFAVRRINVETFRMLVMSFDAWIVGYGLAVVLGTLFGLLDFGYTLWAIVIGIDLLLLRRFFKQRRSNALEGSDGPHLPSGAPSAASGDGSPPLSPQEPKE